MNTEPIQTISVIIPCRDSKNDTRPLEQDIERQKISFEKEVVIVPNVFPAALARNKGAVQAQGQVLVFCDADIRIDDELLLAKLIKPLVDDKNIAMSCAAVRIPRSSNAFQQNYARQIPLTQTEIAKKLTDVFQVPAACCAILKETFDKAGGYNENLMRGEDPELSRRLQRGGYRLVLVPDAWYYHPAPKGFSELARIQFRNGRAVAHVDKFYPELNVDLNQKSIAEKSEQKSKLYRMFRFVGRLFQAVFKLQILFVLAKIFYGLGYITENLCFLCGLCKKRRVDE